MKTQDRFQTEAPPAKKAEIAADPPAPAKKKRTLALVIVLALAVVAILYALRYMAYASSHVSTDDAYVTSDLVQVVPQVTGTVAKVYVQENDHVKAGQLLVELSKAKLQAAYDQAHANFDLAVSQLAGSKTSTGLTSAAGSAQIEQAQGVVQQSTAGVGTAVADVARASAAVAGARANAEAATAGIAGARSEIASANAQVGRARAGLLGAQAAVQSASAAVTSAQAALASAQATFTRANQDYTRAQTLFSQGAISASAADAARANLDVARSQVDAATQGVEAARAGVQQRQAEVVSAREQLTAAQSAVAQAKALLTASQSQANAAGESVRQAIAQQSEAQKSVQGAQGKTVQARGQLSQANTTTRQVEVSRNAESQAAARVEQARAALEQARIDLAHARIYAPQDGVVTKKTVAQGALVEPGAPLMALVPDQLRWVEANFKETQLANVTLGQRAEVEVDAVPGHVFTGTVQSISAGTGSTFALLPPENATGNFTKVVQRIPVRITFDEGQPQLDRLRSGMSVVATITTKR
jgi:membrane fusion protein (multidrug efflux system)